MIDSTTVHLPGIDSQGIALANRIRIAAVVVFSVVGLVVTSTGAQATPPSGTTTAAPGPSDVHATYNLTSKPVVFDALYILPTGSPLSEDAADPGCVVGR
jgi:hypothetical protein